MPEQKPSRPPRISLLIREECRPVARDAPGSNQSSLGRTSGPGRRSAMSPPDSSSIRLAALGVSRRAVQTWVAAYNRNGLGALPDRPRPGRAPILPRAQEGRFLERIDAPPRPEDGVCTLRGADIRRILEQEFAAHYTLDGV